ncbi:MAG: alpha-N-acetylglucosaminidase [Oscillospiraceae bacterium]
METIKSIGMAENMRDKNLFEHLDEKAVKALILRVTHKESYADKFIVRKMQRAGHDSFKLYNEGDKIVIEATSGVSACAGFNKYLKEVCNCFVGPLSKNLNLPEKPLPLHQNLEDNSLFLYRYFMNYCTYGYTMSFWKFEDFEKLIDWMMLSGINLVLNPVAHETVWHKLMIESGYSQKEIDDYLCGPSFFAWQWMGNMTKFGGNLPKWWYQDRVELSNKINERLKSFGASPVLPGFCGLVPLHFKEKFPESNPVEQGLWCGGFQRPEIILPTDVMFNKIADKFYTITKELFGTVHYFSTDPFHEGGNTQGINLSEFGKSVIEVMQKYDENAIWLLQGWGTNPLREMIKDIDKGHLLVTNLMADQNFNGGDNYGGTPWLYCTVNNFGGTRCLSGNVQKSLQEPYKILDKNSDYSMVGIGLMMEAITIDEVFYDILNTISFCNTKKEINDYIEKYVQYRYGNRLKSSTQALKIMANDIYLKGGINLPLESALCTQPTLTPKSVSTWGGEKFTYNTNTLKNVFDLMLADFDVLEHNPPYRLDIADIARQCVANSSWNSLKSMLEAYKNEDEQNFILHSERFLAHFDIQEKIVSTNENMLLGTWLKKATDYATNDIEKRMFSFNAKALITHWGDKTSSYQLRDYAHKEWSGMIEDFYKPRWDAFITMLGLTIHSHDELEEVQWYEFEHVFSCTTKEYSTSPSGDLKAILYEAKMFLEQE